MAFAAIDYMVMAEVVACWLKETSEELTPVRGDFERLQPSSGVDLNRRFGSSARPLQTFPASTLSPRPSPPNAGSLFNRVWI